MTSPAAVRRDRGLSRRVAAVLVTAILLAVPLAGVTLPATGAGTQEPEAGAREQEPGAGTGAQEPDVLLRLEVAEIDGTVTPEEGLRIAAGVVNDGAQPRRDLTLTASVHSRVGSRYEYHQALDERELGAALAAWSVDVDPLPAGATSDVAFRRSGEDLAAVRAHGPGVYPLELALVDDGVTVDSVTTALVVVPDEVDEPLRVSVLAPFGVPPRGGGSLLDRRDRAALTTLVSGLDAGAPVTVAVDGLVLEEIARRAGGGPPPAGRTLPPAAGWSELLDAVDELASGDRVEAILRPTAAADLTALVHGGMTDAAVAAVRDSRAAIARHAGVDPDGRILWPAAGLDAPTLRELVAEGVEAVVLGEEHLSIPSPRELPTSPAPVRPLAAGGGSVDVVVPDPWLSATLAEGGGRGRALATQRLLAETAVVFYERPYTAEPRGVVIAGRRGTAPDRRIPVLLERVGAAPWLRPVTAGRMVAQVPAADVPAQLRPPDAIRADELDPGYVAALRRARERLAGISSSVEGDGRTFDGLATDLRVAASVWYRDRALRAGGRARIRRVDEAVGAVERSITITDLPVTLASVEGELPVTLHSDAAVPVRARVSVESQRYEFAGGSEQRLVLEPGATTVLYGVRALAPGGTHPVRVTVTDDTGTLVLAEGTVVVRSTAVSIVAVVVTVGAALFLVAWWWRDARRRRAAREAPAESSVPVATGTLRASPR